MVINAPKRMMSEVRANTRQRFNFAQFRFIVATILLLAAGLKAYQLATAPLPPVIQGSLFTPLLELFNHRYLLMVVVVGEILFSFILIADLWRQWVWLASLLCFSGFTLVSLMKGLSGESSCGCFGTITVNPWITAVFDLAVVGLLAVFRERFDWTFLPVDRRKLAVVLIAWLVLAMPTLFVMLSLKQLPHATLGTEFTGPDGKQMILLEPETWIGKELPLVSYFVEPHDGDSLKHGEWEVLLIHTDCPKCLQMMADLEARNAESIAIIVVPSSPSDTVPQTSFPLFRLNNRNEWFGMTPCVLKLFDGICTATGDSIIE